MRTDLSCAHEGRHWWGNGRLMNAGDDGDCDGDGDDADADAGSGRVQLE